MVYERDLQGLYGDVFHKSAFVFHSQSAAVDSKSTLVAQIIIPCLLRKYSVEGIKTSKFSSCFLSTMNFVMQCVCYRHHTLPTDCFHR